MLKINTLFTSAPHQQIQALAPVVDDDDELLQAIAEDQHVRDNDWQLQEAPEGISSDFWHSVEEDSI